MLKCSNISMTYRKGSWFACSKEKRVLDDISFDIKEGESFGLLGENGSGKSTLTRIILGLEKPTAGEVLFDGVDVHQAVEKGDKSFRKNMQAVFQDPASTMNPRWSAFRVITEPLHNYYHFSRPELVKQTAELMSSVGLDPSEMDKNINRFSGGQQQRICIARALALKPKLLILDEAVSNLDMIVQAQIVELLAELKRVHNISLLVISHDVRVVFKLCENILVLDNAKIVDRLSMKHGVKRANSEAFHRLTACSGKF
ncbi:ABC transporter ATP-binding protein [Deferribacteres bacterium DY0037]